MVDGIGYEMFPVTGNKIEFTRVFNRGGMRNVMIIPYRNGKSGIPSKEIKLNIVSNGDLEEASFVSGSSCLVANPVTVDWTDVPFAQRYTVYFSDGNTYE